MPKTAASCYLAFVCSNTSSSLSKSSGTKADPSRSFLAFAVSPTTLPTRISVSCSNASVECEFSPLPSYVLSSTRKGPSRIRPDLPALSFFSVSLLVHSVKIQVSSHLQPLYFATLSLIPHDRELRCGSLLA